MNNTAAHWSLPKYHKESNNRDNNKYNKNNNYNKNKTNVFCCQKNNNIYSNQNNNNNKNNKNIDYKNLDNKEEIANNEDPTDVAPPGYINETQRIPLPGISPLVSAVSRVAASVATECDRTFFHRITSNPSSSDNESETTCCESIPASISDDMYRTLPLLKVNLVAQTTPRVHTTHPSRTFTSRYGIFSSFYSILFLFLQLSAVLVSFNIGIALGSNAIDRFGDLNGEVNSEGLGHYTHTWAVHIPNGEENDLANRVARDHGFINRGKIFDDHYHFEHHKVSKRSLTPSDHHQTRLDGDDRVHWSKQQRVKSRQKRDFIRLRPQRTSSRALSLVDAVLLNDPKWPQMWYLNRGGGLDMNVIPAWKEGITGKGIVVTILDDGLESDHPDIEHNYDPQASYDVNSHDDDPMPHYDMTDSNRHGTRCAGEVAATANNSICAVGIAFGASVGGVRMLDGDVTDAVEARSLSLNPQHIDIYSASWGPDDDGKTVDGPGELASRAFIEGVTKGRSGKGSIFIWASGNGGREMDNCNCDGYTNSIWTLSISSATEEGHVPWYSEKCSSTLATTYSSGGQGEKQVVTTDLHHSCTVSHTGTSASAPLAAGIAALVLESNNNLTWRDLQHIVVRTAKPANLKDPTWSKNGVGRRISHSFGYGLMDAAAMVRVARTWKTVPEQQRCEINAPHVDKTIPPEGYITLQLAVKHCMSVNYLEHVQAKITLTSQRRGDIQLYLKSPAGTRVTLLTSRVHDNSRSGFNQWPFMSVHTWGESPHGNWQLEIHNQGRYKGHALLREWSLIFYGTMQPIDPNDPVSTRRSNSAEITTPNSPSSLGGGSSTTTTLHQIYSPLYPRISPSNMATGNGIVKYPAKVPPNKLTYLSNSASEGLSGSVMGPPTTGNNNGGGKKQQQPQQGYQQISATYGVILGSQSKNSKGNGGGGGGGGGSSNKNKNKGSDNKKNSSKASNGNGSGSAGSKSSNNSGGNKKNQAASVGSSNAQKMKLYRILQELQSNINNNNFNGNNNNNNNKNNNNSNNNKSKTKSTTNNLAARPAKLQNMERTHSSEEKTSRKVAGDLPSGPNLKVPLRATVTATTQAASHTKLPIKSTKQVKEKPQLPPPPMHSNEQFNTPVAGNIPDQRIPKMFERYDKIQAIFPEFQPYQGLKDQEASSQKSNTSAWRQTQKYNEAAAAAVAAARLTLSEGIALGSASKPSRENSKKSSQSFVPDPSIMKKQQQLLLAAAATSNSALREELSSEHESAQITQWDLIFYGTKTPAQPEDAVHLSSGKYDSFDGEMEHNDIEFDVSGQWRNMQQVGESSVKSHDRTNTACTNTTIDQRCLVCAPPTFLFSGRCYDECPRHTYIEISDELSPSTGEVKDNDISKQSITEEQDQLLSMDKRRRRFSQSRRLIDESSDEKSQYRQCHICDPSCYQCYGPLNSQCSTCYPGSQLRRQPLPDGQKTFCNIFSERSTGDNSGELTDVTYNTENNPLTSARFLLSMLGLIAFVACFVLIVINRRRIFHGPSMAMKHKEQYSYDRVALLDVAETEVDHDETQFQETSTDNTIDNSNEQKLTVLPERLSNLQNVDSESEEEIDLFSV